MSDKFLYELKKRIMFLDGAMGTMIQRKGLSEADFRGSRFLGRDADLNLRENSEVPSLTQPEVISDIHSGFLDAGEDIIETNTFNSTSISQGDYSLEDHAYELSFEGAKIARKAADIYTAKTPDKPRYVAGVPGPLNKTLSLSPDAETMRQYIEAVSTFKPGILHKKKHYTAFSGLEPLIIKKDNLFVIAD